MQSLCNACGIRFKKEERRNHTINSGPGPSLDVYSAGNDHNITNCYKHITDHHDMNHLTINRSADSANRLHANHDYISINHEVNVGSFNHSTYHNNNRHHHHHHHHNVFSSSLHIDWWPQIARHLNLLPLNWTHQSGSNYNQVSLISLGNMYDIVLSDVLVIHISLMLFSYALIH